MPKISIIVTNYNNSDYIAECLLSLKAQTFKDFECLIVDDGSTDDSINVIRECVEADPRFKVLGINHIGFPLAKNVGLDAAIGDYVIFLDPDDSAYPYWLQMLYEIAVRSGSDITTCLYDEYFDNKAEERSLSDILKGFCVREYSWTKMSLLFHQECRSYLWNKLIRRELWNGIRHEDQIAMSDVSVMYRLFDKANNVVQVRLPLVHYRRHLHSMTAKTHMLGDEYYVFRVNLFKSVSRFIYKKYPQSRNVCRITMLKELDYAQKALGDRFESLIPIDDVQDILCNPCARILL